MKTNPSASAAARTLLHKQFCLSRDQVVIATIDDQTDPSLLETFKNITKEVGANWITIQIDRLPFQGSLADPYVPTLVDEAVASSDIWLDMTFPYLAGSRAFDVAIKAKRTRYVLLGDVQQNHFARLYDSVDYEKLFDLQEQADHFFAESIGKRCKVTAENGTDFYFVIGKSTTRKLRYAIEPGAQTVPGSAIFYPEIDSVEGTIVMDAVFDEFYSHVPEKVTIHLEKGKVCSSYSASAHRDLSIKRSLMRASSDGMGNVVHLTVGLNPGARLTGESFIEDIRTLGSNAIGLGTPWWLPGGGENHPDGVVLNQSLFINDVPIIESGRVLESCPFYEIYAELFPGVRVYEKR